MPFRFGFILTVCASTLGGTAMGQSATGQKDANTIIQRSVAANERDWEAVPKFDCWERDRTGEGTKTYQDIMILGTPYQRLIEINGKRLAAAQAAEEKRKLENAVAERKNESPEKKAERIAKYNEERKRDRSMMDEMVKAFDFKLVGETTLNGRTVYSLQASPRKGYQPPNMETEALTGMEGKLWVDKKTFQWVKVEAHVTRPVSIKGFLAQVEPGTHFELEKIPVAPGIWMAKHFAMRSQAKILRVIPKNGQEDDTYFNYHKANQ